MEADILELDPVVEMVEESLIAVEGVKLDMVLGEKVMIGGTMQEVLVKDVEEVVVTIEWDMLAELVVENRSVEVETLMHFFELEHFALTNFLLSAFKLVISDFNLFTLLSRFSHLLAFQRQVCPVI